MDFNNQRTVLTTSSPNFPAFISWAIEHKRSIKLDYVDRVYKRRTLTVVPYMLSPSHLRAVRIGHMDTFELSRLKGVWVPAAGERKRT